MAANMALKMAINIESRAKQLFLFVNSDYGKNIYVYIYDTDESVYNILTFKIVVGITDIQGGRQYGHHS